MNWKFSRSLCCLFIFSRLNPGRCRYQWQRRQLQSISSVRSAFPKSSLSPILIELQPMCQREGQQQTEVSFYLTWTENGATAENCLVWRLRAESQWKEVPHKQDKIAQRKLTFTYSPLLSGESCRLKNKKRWFSYSISFTFYMLVPECSSVHVLQTWYHEEQRQESRNLQPSERLYAEQVQDVKVRLMLIMFVLFYLSSMLTFAKGNNPNSAGEDRNQSKSVISDTYVDMLRAVLL